MRWQKFSVCSRRSIGTVLERKSHRCFEDESQISVGQCGNFRLDPGEECDPGRSGANKCCLETCKLAPGAQCSPFNHKCCTKARYIWANVVSIILCLAAVVWVPLSILMHHYVSSCVAFQKFVLNFIEATKKLQ
ncbi:unnamed protein product [Dibothriocephalus latus]|uniref:Disintegrin domain-containing protein n=1 Tax=Dibothriocephalus latus TaxID=60516 RepID=A0A3P6T376_DIBLA|nr:unnamed protein product [Dibothriocephalus latus]